MWRLLLQGGKLFSFDPATGENRDLSMRQLLGTVVPVTKDLVVLAACKGVACVNQHTGQPVEFFGPNPEASSFSLRLNDGKCDPQGRLWVGSMDMQYGEAWTMDTSATTAALWCYEGSGDTLKITKKLSGISISNGLVWNKAGTSFFYIDTPTMQVCSCNRMSFVAGSFI